MIRYHSTRFLWGLVIVTPKDGKGSQRGVRACGFCVPSEAPDVADMSLGCSFAGSAPSDEFCGPPSCEGASTIGTGRRLVLFRKKWIKTAKTQ